MDYQEQIKERNHWYSQKYILFEVVKCLKNRELAFLTHKTENTEFKRMIRYLIAFNLEYLDKHFKRFDFDKSLVNAYHSVALLKEIPVFSYNLKNRKEEDKYKNFNEDYDQHVIGYNIFIDIDGKEDFNTAYDNAKQIKKLFDEFKVPYYVLNSSFKGFHFHIPAEYMPKMEIYELLETLNNVIYNLKGIYTLKCLDDSIVDLKRICKVPYSYVNDGSICLPLTDFQFDNYKPENVTCSYVLKNIMIKERGLLLRDWGLNQEELKKNVVKLIHEFK